MMPMVELAYSTVASDAASRNGAATTRKNTKMAMAPMPAPISGRISNRWTRLRSLTRSSRTTLWSATSLSSWVVMSGSPFLACSGLGQLGDGVDVALVDEGRPGQRWLTATDQILVVHEQPERINREVALEVRLLVDGPLDLAALDRVDESGIGVK